MDLQQLRCFVAVADELHFGRAAQRLDLLPAALGRFVRLLEESLGVDLFVRTTRSVALTAVGADLVEQARRIVAEADALAVRARVQSRMTATTLRIGAIDSAGAGLLPMLLQDFRMAHPDIAVQIVEDKTIRLLPRLLSGRLDLAFVRPPDHRDAALHFEPLLHETAVVAMPTDHRLARSTSVAVADLADALLIVPDRRSRPHSHDLTIKLFAEAGISAHISQAADEKQTIVNLVAAGLGLAIVPRWTSTIGAQSVTFVPILSGSSTPIRRLPLAAAYPRDVRDPVRGMMLETLHRNLERYAASA